MANQSTQARLNYTLSVEEMALCLELINRPDLGRSLFLDVYPGLSEEKIEERLTAASHSLLAHGFCGLKQPGTVVLDANFEKALFPLAKFDYLIQVSMTNGKVQIGANIHILRRSAFTTHMVKMGIVHIIEHDAIENLASYVKELFEEFSRAINLRNQVTFEHPVTLGSFSRALDGGTKPEQISQTLQSDGWTLEWADRLAGDLVRQEARASLVLIDASSEMDADEATSAPQKTLLLLQSKDRCWAFQFPGSHNETVGKVCVLDQKQLENLLEQFVLQ